MHGPHPNGVIRESRRDRCGTSPGTGDAPRRPLVSDACITGEATETSYIEGHALPWVPFTPLSEDVQLRYYRIDPVRGEILVSVRFPPHSRVAPLYVTGPVIAHTIRGAWRYREQEWVAKAGDTVFVAAGSTRSIESVGDHEVEVFLVVIAELLFFDENGSLMWQESWKTSMERCAEYRSRHRAASDA